MRKSKIMTAMGAAAMATGIVVAAGCRFALHEPDGNAWISPEEAVSAYVEALGDEIKKMNAYDRVLFLDLDFDGVLELLLHYEGCGVYYCSAYRIRQSDRGVEPVTYRLMEGDRERDLYYNYAWDDSAKLLRNRHNGRLAYKVKGFCRDSSLYLSYTEGHGLVEYKDGILTVHDIDYVVRSRRSAEEDDFVAAFYLNGQRMDEETFERSAQSFWKDFEEVKLTVVSCAANKYDNKVLVYVADNKEPAAVYQGASKETIKEALLKCYKEFKYDLVSR